eukprot:scaffold244903_cov38-Prasinocladus_malaysianus.AAC.1
MGLPSRAQAASQGWDTVNFAVCFLKPMAFVNVNDFANAHDYVLCLILMPFRELRFIHKK